MKKLLLCAAWAPMCVSAAPCLPAAALIERDARYEEALRVGDVPFLTALLADDYVWVHTLASQVETRADILARSAHPKTIYKARTISDVHAHVQGDTVVLRGLSTVDQWNADGKTWRSNRYQFQRTYVTVGADCKLLAVQTMKVWASDALQSPPAR